MVVVENAQFHAAETRRAELTRKSVLTSVTDTLASIKSQPVDVLNSDKQRRQLIEAVPLWEKLASALQMKDFKSISKRKSSAYFLTSISFFSPLLH